MPRLFDLIYLLAMLVAGPVWLWRLIRTGKWRTDWPARFGRCSIAPPAEGKRRILIHAVSVGEVNATRRLVEQLSKRKGGEVEVVISVTTDTGLARARQVYDGKCEVVRYPLDFSWSVRLFLSAVQPNAVALMELEVWPTFVSECDRRSIPVVVLNGRLSERSYRRYRLIRPLIRRAFARLAGVAAQDPAYADRFVGLGARRGVVGVAGNMKWDTATIADDEPGSETLAAAMGIDRNLPLVVVGSSGRGEEAMVVRELTGLEMEGKPVQILIAPRKPERFDEAAAVMGDGVVRRTRCPDSMRRIPDDRRLFLLDTIGELRRAYALANVVIVGRSFCPLHGSDMIEPIALGKPVVIGPNVADFRDVMDRLLEGGGVKQVAGPDHLREAVAAMFCNQGPDVAEKGRAVIRTQQGATDRNLRTLETAMGQATQDPSRKGG